MARIESNVLIVATAGRCGAMGAAEAPGFGAGFAMEGAAVAAAGAVVGPRAKGRQFDRGRRRGFGRQTDPHRFLLRLHFSGFFFGRQRAAQPAGNIISHRF